MAATYLKLEAQNSRGETFYLNLNGSNPAQTGLSWTIGYPAAASVFVNKGGFQFMTGRDTVRQTIKLRMVGSTDEIMTAIMILTDIREAVDNYVSSDGSSTRVNLVMLATGDDGYGYSLISELDFAYETDETSSPLGNIEHATLTLSILRQADFEDVNATSVARNISAIGGSGTQYGLTGVPGASTARIKKTAISAYDGVGTASKVWLGIVEPRPPHDGSTYTPGAGTWWLAENGSYFNGTANATPTAGTAYGTNVAELGNSNGLLKKLSISFEEAWPSFSFGYASLTGEWLVLARLQMDSALQAAIQMRYGWTGYPDAADQGQLIYLDQADLGTTQFTMIELGQVQIPPGGNRENVAKLDSLIRQFQVQLWSDELGNSGNMRVDALAFIPLDHIIIASGFTLENDTLSSIVFRQGPSGEQWAFAYVDDGTGLAAIPGNIEYSMFNWVWPKGWTDIVIATDSAKVDNLFQVGFDFIERKKLYQVTV